MNNNNINEINNINDINIINIINYINIINHTNNYNITTKLDSCNGKSFFPHLRDLALNPTRCSLFLILIIIIIAYIIYCE